MPVSVRDNRGGGWCWLHNSVIDVWGDTLRPYGIAVYVALCRHAGQDQATWVSQRTIANEIGASRAQVHRELEQLEALGLITIEPCHNEHGQTSNIYTLLPVPPFHPAPPLSVGYGGVHLSDREVSGGYTMECLADRPING